MQWLLTRSVPVAATPGRAVADQAIWVALAISGGQVPADWATDLVQAWQVRADALAAYRKELPPEANLDAVLESLLHMHHNRAIGIDPESERSCRRLARHAALAWRARRGDEAGEPR
jgi:thiopeptide-type bacteriocin biosynthesis protein